MLFSSIGFIISGFILGVIIEPWLNTNYIEDRILTVKKVTLFDSSDARYINKQLKKICFNEVVFCITLDYGLEVGSKYIIKFDKVEK